jgi:hypothetical protein
MAGLSLNIGVRLLHIASTRMNMTAVTSSCRTRSWANLTAGSNSSPAFRPPIEHVLNDISFSVSVPARNEWRRENLKLLAALGRSSRSSPHAVDGDKKT